MTHHDTDVVSSLRLEIAQRMTQDRFDLWFAETEIEVDWVARVVKVLATSQFTLDWLRANVRQDVQQACEGVLGADFVVQYHQTTQPSQSLSTSSGSAEGGAAETAPTGESRQARFAQPKRSQGQGESTKRTPQPRRYASFDEFVVGASNKIACMSAQLVAGRLGESSPYFVYGPTGSGKSHLMESIVTELRRAPGRRRCVHISAEQFTFGFVESLKGHGLPGFRRRHREVDLLVIEDVHFLAGKRATISELVHTMDAVTRAGGQLAFSSQLSPSDLGELGDELVNRFCAGLVIQMRAADRPTREAIVRHHAKKKQLPLTDEIVRLIAERVLDDVRKLLGAVNQLSAVRDAFGGEITVETVHESLKPYFSSAPKGLTLRDIEKAVCAEFGLEPRKLKSESRAQRVTGPRMLAMFLARKYTRAALSEIGEHFGRRSHSSVVAANKKMQRLIHDGGAVAMADSQCTIDEAVRRVELRLRA